MFLRQMLCHYACSLQYYRHADARNSKLIYSRIHYEIHLNWNLCASTEVIPALQHKSRVDLNHKVSALITYTTIFAHMLCYIVKVYPIGVSTKSFRFFLSEGIGYTLCMTVIPILTACSNFNSYYKSENQSMSYLTVCGVLVLKRMDWFLCGSSCGS